MKCNVVSFLILVVLVARTIAQDGKSAGLVFNTPIASTVEEAVKQQLIEGISLPKTYNTLLFSYDQPVELHVGSEVAATLVVGRNLRINLPDELSKVKLEILVHEACMRVPYSGWRENANLLSEKTANYWAEFLAAEKKLRQTRIIATPFYKFVVLISKDKNPNKPEVILYNITTGLQELSDELSDELRLTYGMFPRNIRQIAEPGDETKCEVWFRTRLSNPKYHQSIIENTDSRWPIAVHTTCSTSAERWSTIVGERSASAPDAAELGDVVAAALASIVDEDSDRAAKEIFSNTTGDGEKPAVYKNLALLWSRNTVDQMDRIVVKFRCRNTAGGDETK